MSGTDLNIRAFFSDEERPKEICDSLNFSIKEIEVDFSDALNNIISKDVVLNHGLWLMSYSANWKTCLTIRLYGVGEEEVICKILESLGAILARNRDGSMESDPIDLFWGELLLPLWLVIKGVNVEQWEKRALESA